MQKAITPKVLFILLAIMLGLNSKLFAQCTLAANAIYVSPDATGSGAANSPTNLLSAIAMFTNDPTRTPILLSGGDYNLFSTLVLPSGISIEGAYSNNGGNWVKNPAAITNLNVYPPFQYNTIASYGDTGYVASVIGIRLDAVHDVSLTDFNLAVQSLNSVILDTRDGFSVYAVHAVSCSNIKLLNMTLTTSDAQNGGGGARGEAGEDAIYTQGGGLEVNVHATTNAYQPVYELAPGSTGRTAGGAGGFGGALQGYVPCTHVNCLTSGCELQSPAPGGGYGGSSITSNGGNGGTAGQSCAISCYLTEYENLSNDSAALAQLVHGSFPNIVPASQAGTPGTAGQDGVNGVNSTTPGRAIEGDQYYIPGTGGDGQGGTGGGGGGGGGAGGVTIIDPAASAITDEDDLGALAVAKVTLLGIVDISNAAGSSICGAFVVNLSTAGGPGGGGGEGGHPGHGGGGGGAVYGVYTVACSNVSVGNITYNLGQPGTGGTGGFGGLGGQGALGYEGAVPSSSAVFSSQRGARGGNGGNGGHGGKGQDGADGVQRQTWGLHTFDLAFSIDTAHLCTNSIIGLTYNVPCRITAGTADASIPLTVVSTTPTYEEISVPAPCTLYIQEVNPTYGTYALHNYQITKTRNLPDYSLPSRICIGDTIRLSPHDTTSQGYLWKVYQNDVLILTSRNMSWQFSPPNTTSSAVYKVTLQDFTTCCGWSTPLQRSFTIEQPYNLAIAATGGVLPPYCAGEYQTILTLTGAPQHVTGTFPNYHVTYPGVVWSTGDTSTNTIGISQNGTYSVTYTSPIGCVTHSQQNYTTYRIFPLPTVTPTAQDYLYCQSSTISLYAQAPGLANFNFYPSATATQPYYGGSNVGYFDFHPSFPPPPNVPDSLVVYTAAVDQYGCVGPNRGTVKIYRTTNPPQAQQPFTSYYRLVADQFCQASVIYQEPVSSPPCQAMGYGYSSRIAGPAPGADFPVGINHVVYRLTDIFGDTADVTIVIEVVDNIPPVLLNTPPTNLTYYTEPGTCGVHYSPPTVTATDNCSGAITPVIYRQGFFSGDSLFYAGATQYTYVAIDSSHNISYTTMNITVIDNQPPVLTCPANKTYYLSGHDTGEYVQYNLPTIADNCTQTYMPLTFVSGFPQYGFHTVGTTQQTFSSVDQAGNTGTCSFTISVLDTIAPVITCPGPLYFLADTGHNYTHITYVTPTATDNLGGQVTISLVSGKASGDTASIGVYTALYSATDIFNNTSTCPVQINVSSNQAPNLVCPNSITTQNDSGLCTANVAYHVGAALDVDGHFYSPVLYYGLDSGAAFPYGTTNVIYRAIDAEGNKAYCSFTVTVKDTIPPHFTSGCPHDTTVNVTPILCGANITPPVLTGVSHDCIPPSIGILSGSVYGYFTLGTNVQQYQIIDHFGNKSTCSYNVTVIDTNALTVTCPNNNTVSNDAGSCTAYMPNFGNPVVLPHYNTCLTTSYGYNPAPYFPVGTTQLTYTASVNGRQASCSWTITVNDVESPHITAPANITAEIDPGNCGKVINFTAPVGTDNCTNGLVTFMATGLPPGSTFPLGSTLETYVVGDLANHRDTARFTITILDTIKPVIAAHADVVDSTSNMCGLVMNFTAPASSDNSSCFTTTLVSGYAPGSLFPLGTTKEIYVVRDSSGNADTSTFNVIVHPIYPLQAGCVDNVLLPDNTNGNGAIVYYPVPGTVDQITGQPNPCPNVTVMLLSGQGSGAFFGPGPHAENYAYIVRGTGDTVRCTTNVIVTETYPPTIDCGITQSYTIAPDSGVCTASFRLPIPAVSDNGGLVTLTHQIDGVDDTSLVYNFTSGQHSIDYRATDYFSNSAYCSIYVSVRDNFTIGNPFQGVIYCQNEAVNINPDISGYARGLTFQWFTTDSVGNYYVISTDSALHFNAVQLSDYKQYHLVVTDRCGATAYGNEFVLRVTDAPAITLTGLNTSYCISDSSNYTISYSPAGGILSGITGHTFNPRTAGLGPHNITYAYTDTSTGCTGLSSVTVTVYAPPADSLFADSVYCINAGPIQLPSVNSTYLGAGISGSVFTPGTAGAGYHTLTRNVSAHGCSAQLVQNVRVNAVIPNPTITLPTAVCISSGLYPVGRITTGGVWTGSYLVVDSLTGNAKFDSHAARVGFDTVIYTVTKSACTAGDTAFITVNDNYYNLPYTLPQFCNSGPPVAFDTTAGKKYIGLGFHNGIFYPDSVGLRGPEFYAVVTTNSVGCKDTFVRILNLLGGQLDVYTTQAICKPGDSLFINLGNQYDSIRWYNGSMSNHLVFTDTGSYSVFLRDTGGCYGYDTLHVRLYTMPQIVPAATAYACPGDSVTIFADSAFISYHWSNGDSTRVIEVLPGSYTVTVTTNHGCVYTSAPVIVSTGPDVIAPTITCPNDTLLFAPAGSCAISGIGLGTPIALDNCGLAAVTNNAAATFSVGTTQVVWTAHDLAGNTSTCIQRVTVNDTIKPYFTTVPVSGFVTDTSSNNCSTQIPNFVSQFAASDSCSGVSLTQSPAAGSLATAGTTAVGITARDSSGNTTTYFMIFQTQDTVAPVVNCPADITANITGTATTAIVHYTAPLQAANCTNSTVQRIAGLASGSAFPIGVTTQKFVVTDGSGATDTCSFNITVTHTVGIGATTATNLFSVSPVPATDHLNVIYQSAPSTIISLKLTSMTGQLVLTEELTPFDGNYNKMLDISKQAAGTYILEITSDQETVTRKIVKL